MTIPESQLDTWSKQGSITQSSATYATIKLALEDPNAPYASQSYTIFLQGSYGNDTNIYADSDVDIVIRLDSIFYHDLEELPESQREAFHQTHGNATTTLADFKLSVTDHLIRKFGSAAKPGSKAIFIKGEGARRDADVLVAAKYRRYFAFNNSMDERYVEGICFFASDGTRIANYPAQHSDNCTAKHKATDNWYKPSVRILKNMRNRMIDDRIIKEGLAPSYFLQGMAYNVPNLSFGGTYISTIANCLNFVLNHNDRTKLVCANEQHYLLRDGTAVTWNEADCMTFIREACDFWNKW